MATVNASQLSLEKTLEELITEYNDLRTDVSAVTFETLISDSGGTITFEGATDDDYETTLAVVDPTADRTVSLPNATGTVLTTGNADAGDVTAVSGDLDHVLINDGGVLKRMTLSNMVAGLPTLTPATADGAALGSATKEWSDLFLADEGVINFGNDQDIALTHAQDTSLAISGGGTTTGLIIDNTATDGDPFLQFALSGTGLFTMGVDDGDSDLFKIGTTAIGTSTALTLTSAGLLTISDDLVIKDGGTIGSATTIDAITVASDGIVTFKDDIKIKDGGTIGSATDTDAISISSAGVVGFSATTEASATGTAAVTLAGGLGVAKDIWVGDDIVLDSDSAVIKLGDAQEITLTHVTNTGLNLKHTATGDNTPIILTLQTGETDITADEPLGTINFQAPDETGGTDAILVAAAIEAVAEGTFAADNNATKLSFKTGASEAAAEKMSISSVGNVTMKNTAVGDDTPMVLSLLSGETDIAASDVIGKIEWSAPDEGTGTDAILVCGAVDVVSEGDFAADNNATKMSFRLGSSETATEKMQLSSAGALQVDGSLTCTPTSTLLIKDSSGSTLKTVYGVASN